MGEQAFNINFVQTVQKYPCVYDHTRMDYCLRHITEAAWSDISKEVGEDVKICKEKWKNLRTVFRRNVLKDGGASKRPYYLNEHMQFMIPLLQGSKKRGRSWFQYHQIDGSSIEEVEPESPREDSYYIEEEEEEERYRAEDASEDPMRMVETVINRESPGNRRSFRESHERDCRETPTEKRSEERPSTTRIKIEPEAELIIEPETRQNMSNHMKIMQAAMNHHFDWSRVPIEEMRHSRNEAKQSAEQRLSLLEDRRHSICDPEDIFEQPKKKIKIPNVEPKTEASFSGETRKSQCNCHDCPDTQFLLSLKPDLAQMTPRQKRKFKREIFNLMDAILDNHDTETSRLTPNLPTSSTNRFMQRK